MGPGTILGEALSARLPGRRRSALTMEQSDSDRGFDAPWRCSARPKDPGCTYPTSRSASVSCSAQFLN